MNPVEVVVVLIVCVLGPALVLFLINRKTPPRAALIELPEVFEQPDERSDRRLLFAVRELHRRGYEQLRISPGMARSGVTWRCELVAAGAPAEMYMSAMERRYFGWTDTEEDGAKALADKIEQRFPALMQKSRAPDPTYVRWYVQMLARTIGDVPVSYDADMGGPDTPPWYVCRSGDALPEPPA